MTHVGYVRVSTAEQDPAVQRHALEQVGVQRVYTDVASGASANRPQLAAALDYVREGDQLVVWKLDRLGRSLSHLIATVDGLRERGITFRSLTEEMDTATPQGQLLFHLFGAFAEFERGLIRERTAAGLAVARANGRVGGRRPVLTSANVRYARRMYAAKVSVTDIARSLSCSRATVHRALRAQAA